MAKKEHGRPSVSTDRFATAVLIEDSGANIEYEAVKEIETDLITIKYTPKMNSSSMYASGVAVESYVAKAGGTLDATVVGLTDEEEVDYFGSGVAVDGVVVENKDDYVPDLAVIWSTKRSDGKINLYKTMKTKFASQGEEATTSDDNGVTFNGTALQGDYKALINSGDIMFKKKKVDPKTADGAALIETWFGTALGGIALTGSGSGSDENAPDVTATGGTKKVTLTWEAVTGAEKYMVKQYDNGICTILTNELSETSYEDTGLADGKTYYYLVQAYVGGVWSSSGAAYLVNATTNE